jgi:fused signal recognition particle receptor
LLFGAALCYFAAGMDPIASQDLVSALVVIGGFVGSSLLALFFARRARAARLRQIEGVGEKKSVVKRATSLRELQEPDDAGEQAPQPRVEAEAPAPELRAAIEPQREAPAKVMTLVSDGPSATAVPRERPRSEKPTIATRVRDRDTALAKGLARTRSSWVARLGQVFAGRKELDPGLVDDIERVLLTADIGIHTASRLLGDLRESLSRKELSEPSAVWEYLRRRTTQILDLDAAAVNTSAAKPFVLLIIGVNGTGKTTTIGKLAARFRGEGKSVVLAAGDTFRAAAVEQLEVWGQRTSSPVIKGKEGSDPSSVIFEAIKHATATGTDVIIADTAGRLHTKSDLMDELRKVRRVIGKAMEGAPHETWLVLDSTSGQNAIQQAQIFTQAMQVSGIVLTKLDGTAKGGVILGIADQLKIPVRFIGVGERVEDLRPFDASDFVEALYDISPEGESESRLN